MGDPGAEPFGGVMEALAAELVAVVDEDALEPPAGLLEFAGDAAGELGGLRGVRVVVGADDEPGAGSARRRWVRRRSRPTSDGTARCLSCVDLVRGVRSRRRRSAPRPSPAA